MKRLWRRLIVLPFLLLIPLSAQAPRVEERTLDANLYCLCFWGWCVCHDDRQPFSGGGAGGGGGRAFTS